MSDHTTPPLDLADVIWRASVDGDEVDATGPEVQALIARVEELERERDKMHDAHVIMRNSADRRKARAEAGEAKIAAVRDLHAAKHGEKPVYASDDWHAERVPVEWVAYAVCTGCSASYPCPTIAALDGTA